MIPLWLVRFWVWCVGQNAPGVIQITLIRGADGPRAIKCEFNTIAKPEDFASQSETVKVD